MSPQPAELLRRARARIEANGFAKSYEAERADGSHTGFDSDDAVRHCPSFAIIVEAPTPPGAGHPVWWGEDCYWAMSALVKAINHGEGPLGHDDGAVYIDAVAAWSKQLALTTDAVLATFDRAITIAEAWEADVADKLLRAQMEEATRRVKAGA